jgi:hypothetical protein
LKRYQEVADFTVVDLKNEVEEQSDKRKFIVNATNIVKEASAIINGNQSEKELFDMAMEFAKDDYGMRVGEIENFFDQSQSFIDGLDIQNGVFEQEALDKMQKFWDESATSLLIGDATRVAVEKRIATVAEPTGVPLSGEFNRFFQAQPTIKQ